MIALDFKLSSGQVRTLLYIYQGGTMAEFDAPEQSIRRARFANCYFATTSQSLVRKGLVEHRPEEYPHGQCWHVTGRGRAIAEMIVEQARHIVELDESRIARDRALNREVKG